jgi:hypothetical protein
MKNTYSWIGTKGNVFELEAECTMEVIDEVLPLDGYEMSTGNKVNHTKALLTAKVDGIVVDTCWNTNFWKVIDMQSGAKKIWGIKNIGFVAEKAAEIEAFLNDVIESAKTEDVKEIEKVEESKMISESIEIATSIIEKAKKQNTIPTEKEAREAERKWNNLYNEGGNGYVPHIVDIDEYNWALSIINK